MTTIRKAAESDLPAIAEIQRASPEAAHWSVPDYLDQDCWVATVGGRLAGFLVCRAVAADEREVLNIAVGPQFRRRGIARALLEAECNRNLGDYFLEVRASNIAARAFYSVIGFTEVGVRQAYYENPPESGIVMKRRSCYRHNVRRP
ncbi:MAG: GNAT family N-acetyltransferase [Bryobacteraceae bacterium]